MFSRPRMAIDRPSEQFIAKMIRCGDSALMSRAIRSRHVEIICSQAFASAYAPRPADAPQLAAKSTIASVTAGGLGKLVAELSI